jgi:hypothetical protein
MVKATDADVDADWDESKPTDEELEEIAAAEYEEALADGEPWAEEAYTYNHLG